MVVTADALHYRADLLTNFAVLISVLATAHLKLPVLDAAVGMGIAFVIAHSAIQLFRQAYDQLMDREVPGEIAADVEKIAHLQLAELEKRLAERDINITFTQKAISAIADIGYEPEFGARPLKRAIQQYIATPIAQELLKRAAKRSISVDYKNDKFIIE